MCKLLTPIPTLTLTFGYSFMYYIVVRGATMLNGFQRRSRRRLSCPPRPLRPPPFLQYLRLVMYFVCSDAGPSKILGVGDITPVW